MAETLEVWGKDMRRRTVVSSLLVAAAVFALLVWPGWIAGSGDGASRRSLESNTTPTRVSQVRAKGDVPTQIPLPVATPTPVLPRPQNVTGASAPWVNAEQIAVVDDLSGELIYGRNEHERTPMASVTKIATAIVALEHGNLQDIVRVNYDPNELYDSTAMGCNPGEWYTLEDLLYGLMLPSGNDAALAIANHIAGSKDAFVALMNEKVRELGLNDTHFVNPHGLDEAGHYSSAYDMAMLARYAMKNPDFRKLASAKLWDVRGSKSYRIFNLNRFLWNYEGADGVKIGYTEGAGRTTVASASRGGHRVYVSFMHGGDIVKDVVPLFDYVFKNFEWRYPVPGASSR